MLAINCSAAETAMPVGIAFRGETRAGITVPALGAAEAGTSFERPHVKVESAELVKLVKPGNVGADDRIEIRRHIRPWRTVAVATSMHSFPGAGQLATLGIARLSGQHRTGRLRAAVTENRGLPRCPSC